MYLKQSRVNGRTHLVIAHGYRDRETKKVRTKTVQTLGYLDELEKRFENPVAHFREVVAEMNRNEAAEKSLCNIKIDPRKKIEADTRKNIGYAPLSQIYHRLELNTLLNNHFIYTSGWFRNSAG